MICFRLLTHCVRAAASRTFCTAGTSSAIRMAMIAITTSSSISVNALRCLNRILASLDPAPCINHTPSRAIKPCWFRIVHSLSNRRARDKSKGEERSMFHPKGPSFLELARQALSSTERGYDLLAPKFEYTPFRTPDVILDQVGAYLKATAPFGAALDICC